MINKSYWKRLQALYKADKRKFSLEKPAGKSLFDSESDASYYLIEPYEKMHAYWDNWYKGYGYHILTECELYGYGKDVPKERTLDFSFLKPEDGVQLSLNNKLSYIYLNIKSSNLAFAHIDFENVKNLDLNITVDTSLVDLLYSLLVFKHNNKKLCSSIKYISFDNINNKLEDSFIRSNVNNIFKDSVVVKTNFADGVVRKRS